MIDQEYRAVTREFLSHYGFEETVRALQEAIRCAGMRLFGIIDHRAAARDAGLAMPRTVVLLYGNPASGTPLMLRTPLAALDLPLRVLVREGDDGRICVAYHGIVPALAAAGVPAAQAQQLAEAQTHLVAAVKR